MTKCFQSTLLGLFLFTLLPLSVSAWGQVNIDSTISVSPDYLRFGKVFPEEVLYKNLDVGLSASCRADRKIESVEYKIIQVAKAKISSDAAYCETHPTDLTRCYPSLCPYLSKEPDNKPVNDTGVPAFHDPLLPSSVAVGLLTRTNDPQDKWTIDLHVPCFRGECAQDNVIPRDYELDPNLHGREFNCNFKIVVSSTTKAYQEKGGTIGFWKNWRRNRTYTEAQIDGWLADINTASGWLMTETGYPANTTGMVNLINASNGCSGSTRSCAKLKFAAQYMATNLNVSSGRKAIGNSYNLNSSQQIYLGLGNPVQLSAIFTKTEGKLPDNGTNPTRTQFLMIQSLFDSINNTSS